jgi:hypothetical protein
MAKQTFTAGQVLTAAQVNALQSDIFNQTVSTKVANYTLVAADAGTRLVGDGTSITFTVNNTLFTAGDTVKIHNINSTALTIAAGAGVTINAAAGLTMVQYQEAVLFATSASSFILFESSAATTTQGLSLISTTSFSGVSSISAPADTFTSTYANYRILLSLTSSTNSSLEARLRAAGSDDSVATYNHSSFQHNSSNASGIMAANTNLNRWIVAQTATSITPVSLSMDIFRPKETERTAATAITQGSDATNYNGYFFHGVKAATTSFDSISFIFGSSTGRLSVYGYNN